MYQHLRLATPRFVPGPLRPSFSLSFSFSASHTSARGLSTSFFTSGSNAVARSITSCVRGTHEKPATRTGRAHSSTLTSPTTPPSRRLSTSTVVAARPREFFVEHGTERIRNSKPAWPHPIYTEAQMNAVVIAHRDASSWSDWAALGAVRIMRWWLDLATGYRHDKSGFAMTADKYMIRNVFLESVAGVPGMVGGMMRHLASMRRMKRDNGWIETLLEESYNERMHLLTFLKLYKPGLFMRAMVLGAQGVFFNAFFIAYLISPRTCHRFVGYLEEEAVITYTREINDIDAGKLPEWERLPAPDIAVTYWNMPEGKRTMRDLLLYIRADESKHREVNHTLGNLDQRQDPNPYVSEYKDPETPHPTKGIEFPRPKGWERDDVI